MFVGVLTILKVPLSSQGQTPYVPTFGVIFVCFFYFLSEWLSLLTQFGKAQNNLPEGP